MSLITEYESNGTIPVKLHIVNDDNIIGYTVNDTIPCTSDRTIPSNAFVVYLTDIQKTYNATYSFAISYDESTRKATEIKSVPMDDTCFSNHSGYNTTMLMIVLQQRQEKKNINVANGTRRKRRTHQSGGTRKQWY